MESGSVYIAPYPCMFWTATRDSYTGFCGPPLAPGIRLCSCSCFPLALVSSGLLQGISTSGPPGPASGGAQAPCLCIFPKPLHALSCSRELLSWGLPDPSCDVESGPSGMFPVSMGSCLSGTSSQTCVPSL